MAYQAPILPYVSFPATPDDLPVRSLGDQGGPEYIVRARHVENEISGVRLAGFTQTEKCLSILVAFAAQGVVRVLLEGDTIDPHRITLALPQKPPVVEIIQTENQIQLMSEDCHVTITLDPFNISWFRPDGFLLLEQNATDSDTTDRLTALPFGLSQFDNNSPVFHDTFTAQPDEHYYGFGEKFSHLDKRGQRLEMWNYDAFGSNSERAYKNVPFYLSTQGYGIFVDSVSRVNFDAAYSNHSVFMIMVPEPTLDYYFITGPDIKTIISRYAALVSFPILPPKWAFGLWMSSGFQADNDAYVIERAQMLRDMNIPCDVMHLDCYWQRFGLWSEMLWDEKMFPDPVGLIRRLHDMHYKVCLWINSYIGAESVVFKEAEEKGFLFKRMDGSTYVADLWNGYHPPVGIVDFTNPDACEWFKDLLRPLLKQGVDVFKTDFGEGVPPDAVAWNGMSGESIHNYYSLVYNDLVSEVTTEVTGNAGLVWGRSSYAGGQRHAAQWSGDVNCTFTGLATTIWGGLNFGLCGHAFWGHDIGGFHRTPTPEVYARWIQFGAFSPMARAHGMSSRLPWDYGEEVTRIFYQYMQLRYSLMPYIYTYAIIAEKTSLPLMRAMLLEYPDDPNTYSMDLQYMFGREFLVAPIYNKSGYRPVYFPAGNWIDYWTEEVISGPATHWIKAPLDVMPIYVKGDSLIPTVTPVEHLSEEPFEFIIFKAYVLKSAEFRLLDVDGETQLSVVRNGETIEIELSGAKARVGIHLIALNGTTPVRQVLINGQPLEQQEQINLDPQSLTGWAISDKGTLQVMVNRSS
jgi:alpha-D-xyloside xylohydrolase